MISLNAYKSFSNEKKSPFVVSIASGKGGVGKTLTTINLAIATSNIGLKVLILDGDLGLANVDILLGLKPEYNLKNVLDGHVSIKDIIVEGPGGIAVITSGSGLTDLQNLNNIQRSILSEQIEQIQHEYDLILIDSGAGINDNVLHFNSISHKRLIVTSPEPHSITDAYALIKVLNEERQIRDFSLMINMATSAQESQSVARGITTTCAHFLDLKIDYLGYVPMDKNIVRMLLNRQIGGVQALGTLAGQAWNRIAGQYIENIRQFQSEMNKQADNHPFWNHFLDNRPKAPEGTVF